MLHVAILAFALAADAPKDQKDQQKITPAGYFDVAVCSPNRPTLPDAVNKEILQGVVQSARPEMLECLTDAKNRTGDGQVVVTIDSSMSEAGVTHKITAPGLSPAGTACVQKAIDDWTKSFSQLKSKDAVSSQFQFGYMPGVQPSAKLGLNEASDIFAQVRLAQPAWCDCYAEAAKAGPVPAEIRGMMKLKQPEKSDDKKPQPTEVAPSDVTLQPLADAAGQKVAACVKGKLMATKFKSPSEPELDVPVQVLLVNANYSGKLPGAPAPLQFAQYDINGNQLIAQMFIDDGARAMADSHYGDLANEYNTHKKKGLTLVQVTEACQQVVKLDPALVADTQKLFAQAKEVHDFTVEQKAKDPNWGTAEAATGKRVPAIEAQADKVQKLADADKARCEKLAAEEKEVPVQKPSRKPKKKGKK